MEQQRTALMHSHPEQIVARGEEIYARKFKKEFENKHHGKFAVIDITTEKAYFGDFSGDALQSALNDSPHGIFHLIRIGSRVAHKIRRQKFLQRDHFRSIPSIPSLN